VTFDDVTLRECAAGEAARGGEGKGVPVDPSREEEALAQEWRARVDYSLGCEDVDACLAVGTFEPVRGAAEVQWGPVTEIDEAIVRELMDELPGEDDPGRDPPRSGGTVAVTRYLFNGQVVATRRGDELYFLSPDHPSTLLRTGLGSASLVLDEGGAWLADHRFHPYGERRRSDGASFSLALDSRSPRSGTGGWVW
jgi:hypothetical protein